VASQRETKNQTEAISPLNIPVNSELSGRLQKISEQTGLSTHNLLQKWILQEESLIGLMRSDKEQKEHTTEQEEAQPEVSRQPVSVSRRRKETQEADSPDSPDYQKTLVKKAAKLKKEGMTLVKIAEIFNGEKLQTVSGKGKWYPSSLVRLLNSKA
jgi:hypothetical protein